jgi:hypothetical protein
MRRTALRTVTALAAAVTMAACGDSGMLVIERVQLEDENHDGADDHGSDDGGSVG